MRLPKLLVVFCLIGFSACGGKSPIAPGPPPISTTALEISGPDTLLSGVPVTYMVRATLSDGTTATVTAVWTTSDPAIASIDSTGRLEGRTHGSTNVVATYEGRSTSKGVHVVNNYGGTWEASYIVRTCTDSGDLTNYDGGWCRSGWAHVGNVIKGVKITLDQSGSNLSDISGSYGYFEEPIHGVVTADGRLTLGGTFTDRDWWENPENILDAWQIRAWDSSLSAAGVMSGRWSEHLISLYPRRGEGDVDFDIVTMTRTAKSPSVLRQD